MIIMLLCTIVLYRYKKIFNCMGPVDAIIGAICFLLKTSIALSSSSLHQINHFVLLKFSSSFYLAPIFYIDLLFAHTFF